MYEIIFNQQRERMMSRAAQGEIVARGDLPQLLCGVERTDNVIGKLLWGNLWGQVLKYKFSVL